MNETPRETASVATGPPPRPRETFRLRLRRLVKRFLNVHVLRGAVGIFIFLGTWQLARPLGIPFIQEIPSLSDVVQEFVDPQKGLFWREKYLASWVISFFRISAAFLLAMLIGIPQGFAWGLSRRLKALSFPVFETLRPIPPLAYLPVAVYLMPTIDLSIILVIFLGAYFCIVINVINGVYAIDLSYIRAALSLGARRRDIFLKIILPGTMPSIATGMGVGMGIAWMEIVAAEMIAGRAGLGFFTWESHVGGNTTGAVAGMISIGVAGAFSSAIVWRLGAKLTPWKRLF